MDEPTAAPFCWAIMLWMALLAYAQYAKTFDMSPDAPSFIARLAENWIVALTDPQHLPRLERAVAEIAERLLAVSDDGHVVQLLHG